MEKNHARGFNNSNIINFCNNPRKKFLHIFLPKSVGEIAPFPPLPTALGPCRVGKVSCVGYQKGFFSPSSKIHLRV